MGLRLYQPPVESDIKSRSAADKILSHARGIIRQSRISLSSEQQRDRRRRILAGLEARRRSPPTDALTGAPAATDNTRPPLESPENGRQSLRDVAGRSGVLDEHVVAMFSERWAHLHAESNSPLRDDDEDRGPSSFSGMAVEPEFLGPRRIALPAEPYVIPGVRSTQILHSSRRPLDNNHARRVAAQQRMARRDQFRRGLLADYRAHIAAAERTRRRGETQLATETAQVDGLGDRNRSLSPEGDNVWDTLLSTLTPDPQPPSVGSSFASASGSTSGTASQSAAPTRSSVTSFTGPETIEEEPPLEQPCESGCENSDTEGDEEEEEAEQNPLVRFTSGLRASQPRSYADIVSRSSSFDDPLDMLSDIRGMQRIVRTLANREDIPDEWWAQVGLSRTLSREASTN